MASSILATSTTPSVGLLLRGPSTTKQQRARRAATVTRGAAAGGGGGVEASTDGKHEAAAMAALDNCVTASNLNVGDKYKARGRVVGGGAAKETKPRKPARITFSSFPLPPLKHPLGSPRVSSIGCV